MFCSCEVHFPQVAVGGQFSQVLLNNPRKLWTCGPRETGALGRHFDHDDDDDDHELQLVEIPGNEDVVRVCSGDTFAVAVVGDGGMFLWGSVRPGFDVKATLDGFNIQYTPKKMEVAGKVVEAGLFFFLIWTQTPHDFFIRQKLEVSTLLLVITVGSFTPGVYHRLEDLV